MATHDLGDTRWPVWFLPDVRAAGLLAYHRGVIVRRAANARVVLIDETGHIVDSRAARAGERFVPCTTVQFPCHVARIEDTGGHAKVPTSGDAHGGDARSGGFTSRRGFGEPTRSHSVFDFLPYVGQCELLASAP